MKICIGNWKMNGRRNQVSDFIGQCLSLPSLNHENVGFAMPSVYLSTALATKSRFKIGAQDISSYENNGAYTGEVSAEMVKDIGATFTLIAHSERRSLFAEDASKINKKLHASHKAGLKSILCIGESLNDRQENKTLEVLSGQLDELKSSLQVISVESKELTIAYEPVWAIGTGKVASIEDIEEVHDFLHSKMASEYKDVKVQILYGGSVKADNAFEILSLKQVEGVLVGGASLSVFEFEQITKAAQKVNGIN